jgi:hypothetical protein
VTVDFACPSIVSTSIFDTMPVMVLSSGSSRSTVAPGATRA